MLSAVHPISIATGRVVRVLILVAVWLVFASVATQVMRHYGPHDTMLGLIDLVNLNEEANLPTFFSSLLIVCAAALAGTIAACTPRGGGSYRRHWIVLALLLVFMAADETAVLHERMAEPAQRLLGERATGPLFLAWVVPGSALVLGVVVAYLRFWLRLPPRTRFLTAAATAIFFGGAIGVELLEGLYLTANGTQDFRYQMITTLQESMEMAGMIVLIGGLLDHLRSLGTVQLSWEEDHRPFRARAIGGEAER